jgi:glycosyltransferase involved in cell wall biosynthesis
MLVHGPYPVGEPRVTREAAVALDEGFEVDVVAMRRPSEASSGLVDGVRVRRLPLTHRRDGGLAATVVEYVGFTMLASVVVAWRQLTRRYDVVHVHNPPDFLVAAALIPRLLGARVIFDVHDLSPHMFGARFRRGVAASTATSILVRIERLAARLADAVITVHEPYRRELAAHGVDPAAITVVMNSLDERLLPTLTPGDDGQGRARIVYHGTITPWYGVDLLVQAAVRLRDDGLDFGIELYGEGDAVEAIRAAVAESGLAGQVRANGVYLPHAEVLEKVAGASIGVIPNLPSELNRFALSSKLFEYVALGIPVVSADLPTIREHFSDAEVRFFRAGDAASLAEALADVLTDPDAATVRAARARERYEAYRWPISSARYARVLRGLVAT